MPKYLTVDQHIKWKGEYIPPGTTVAVDKEDQEIWDKLVRQKVAVKVGRKPKAPSPEETLEDTSPDPLEG